MNTVTIFDDYGNIVFQEDFDTIRETIREGDRILSQDPSYSGEIELTEGGYWTNDNDGRGWITPTYRIY